MTALQYKPSLRDAQTRLRLLYDRRGGDRIFATMQTPNRAIVDFARLHPHGECQCPDLDARVGEMPICVFAPFETFSARLLEHSLPGGVLYQVRGVPDIDAANRLMEQVRAYRI